MAVGGHFGFRPDLMGLVHTCAGNEGAHFLLNTSKYPNQLSESLPLLLVVTECPNMTLLFDLRDSRCDRKSLKAKITFNGFHLMLAKSIHKIT